MSISSLGGSQCIIVSIDYNKGYDNITPQHKIGMRTMRLYLSLLMISMNVLIVQSIGNLYGSEDFYAQYVGKQFVLRSTYSQNKKVYISIDSTEFSYIYSKQRVFPVNKPLEVTIVEVKQKKDYVKVKYKHHILGEGEIELHGPKELLSKEEYFSRLLMIPFCEPATYRENYKDEIQYYGHRKSKLIHVIGCNHIPDKEDLIVLHDLKGAKEIGYKECKICFPNMLNISAYELESYLSLEIAARVRYFYPLVIDKSIHERVDSIGQKVLAEWPEPLKGYTYSFKVIESDTPNAIACPAGKIYITMALLGSLDSDEELEAILAHEIVHVEKRHGYRQYLDTLEAMRNAALAEAITGTIVAAAGGDIADSYIATELAGVITTLASSITLFGHSRQYEMEADLLTLYYFTKGDRMSGIDAFHTVLNKMKYYEDSQDLYDREAEPFSTHPSINSRIDAINNGVLQLFSIPYQYVGLNADRDTVAIITFDMQYFRQAMKPYKHKLFLGRETKLNQDDGSRLRLHATLETTMYMARSTKLKDIDIFTQHDKMKLDNKENTEICPSSKTGLLFKKDGNNALIEGEIQDIKLSIPGVEEWVQGM